MANDVPDWTGVVARPASLVAGSPFTFTAAGLSIPVAVTPDVHAIGIVIVDATKCSELTVVGGTTNVAYADVFPASLTEGNVFTIPIHAAIDPVIDIVIGASGTSTVYLTLIHDTEAVVSFQQDQTYNVRVTQVDPIVTTLPNERGTLWFQNNQVKIASINFGNPALNATAVVIPAPGAGKNIYLWKMVFAWTVVNASVFGQWQDSNGNIYATVFAAAAGVPFPIEFEGLQLPTNTDFEYKEDGSIAAGTSRCFGYVAYSVV